MGGILAVWRFVREVRWEEGSGVKGLFSGSTAVRRDLTGFSGDLMAPRAASPAGRMRLAQAGRGER